MTATCSMSKVPIGAHVRDPSSGAWRQVTDVVRVRDGSGDIRLTLANGDPIIAGPNEPVEIRTADGRRMVEQIEELADDDE